MRLISSRSLILLPIALAFAGCTSQQRVATETALAKALVSDEQLNQLGLQVHQELEKQGVQFEEDPAINNYVQGIASDIFQVAKQDREGVDWHVHVIRDPKTVNAFATPGGHLYVYSGLLAAADNKAEVAGVMAHEVGHVAGRHIERQLVAQTGLETVASLALGKNPSQLSQLATALLGRGALLAYGRSEENEADALGVKYASAAGYDPNGLATFFEKLQQGEGKQPAFMTFLSTHPATGDRIEHVRKLIQSQPKQGGVVGQEEHQPIRQRILAAAGQGGQGQSQQPGPGQTPEGQTPQGQTPQGPTTPQPESKQDPHHLQKQPPVRRNTGTPEYRA